MAHLRHSRSASTPSYGRGRGLCVRLEFVWQTQAFGERAQANLHCGAMVEVLIGRQVFSRGFQCGSDRLTRLLAAQQSESSKRGFQRAEARFDRKPPSFLLEVHCAK